MGRHKKDSKALFHIWTEKNRSRVGFRIIATLGLITLAGLWSYFLVFKK